RRRAVQVVPGPAAGQAAQRKAREGGGLSCVAGPARRELPDLPGPAEQDVQGAVDVDDLSQLGRAELVEQYRDGGNPLILADISGSVVRAGAHHGFEPALLALKPD